MLVPPHHRLYIKSSPLEAQIDWKKNLYLIFILFHVIIVANFMFKENLMLHSLPIKCLFFLMCDFVWKVSYVSDVANVNGDAQQVRAFLKRKCFRRRTTAACSQELPPVKVGPKCVRVCVMAMRIPCWLLCVHSPWCSFSLRDAAGLLCVQKHFVLHWVKWSF